MMLFQVRSAVKKGGFDMKINTELANLELEFKKQGLGLDTFKNFLTKIRVRVRCFYNNALFNIYDRR